MGRRNKNVALVGAAQLPGQRLRRLGVFEGPDLDDEASLTWSGRLGLNRCRGWRWRPGGLRSCRRGLRRRVTPSKVVTTQANGNNHHNDSADPEVGVEGSGRNGIAGFREKRLLLLAVQPDVALSGCSWFAHPSHATGSVPPLKLYLENFSCAFQGRDPTETQPVRADIQSTGVEPEGLTQDILTGDSYPNFFPDAGFASLLHAAH